MRRQSRAAAAAYLSSVAARMYLPFGENLTNDTGGLSSSGRQPMSHVHSHHITNNSYMLLSNTQSQEDLCLIELPCQKRTSVLCGARED